MEDILNAPLSPICQVDYCWQIEIATFVDVMDGIWCQELAKQILQSNEKTPKLSLFMEKQAANLTNDHFLKPFTSHLSASLKCNIHAHVNITKYDFPIFTVIVYNIIPTSNSFSLCIFVNIFFHYTECK